MKIHSMSANGLALLTTLMATMLGNAAMADQWTDSPTFKSTTGFSFSFRYRTEQSLEPLHGFRAVTAVETYLNGSYAATSPDQCAKSAEVHLMSYTYYNEGGYSETLENTDVKKLSFMGYVGERCLYTAKLAPITLLRDYEGIRHYGRQEVAILVGQDWQVDPINQTHNFKIQLQ